MSQQVQACPHDKTYIDLLNGSHETNDAIDQHLRNCALCRKRFESLSDSKRLDTIRPLVDRSFKVFSFLEEPLREEDLGRINDILIEEEIGRGGLGIVFRGFDSKLQRHVAVKVLNNDASFRSDSRFERESTAAAKVRGDFVVPVHATGKTIDGRPYLTMPLIQGGTLRERLADGVMDHSFAALVVKQIAQGLATIHDAGLVHRDVKPANVLMDNEDNRAKLTDFGMARAVEDASLTQTGVLCGTPEYMSPEQANLDSPQPQCDIYSLGIVLYECLTGSVPFRGRPLDVLAQHRDFEPVVPSRIIKSIPCDLETICLKAIEKDPDRRYETAASLAADLQNFIENRPILAKPASRLEKLSRWSKRNPRIAGLGAALAVSLVGGILTTTWMWRQSQDNFVEAQSNFVEAQENFDIATDMVLQQREFANRLALTTGHETAARDLYRQLLQKVDQLVLLRKNDPDILLLQPKVYASAGEMEAMVGDTRHAIALFDKCERLLLNLKEVAGDDVSPASKSNEMGEGINLTHLNHWFATVYLNRGESFHRIGRKEDALEDYRSANKLFEEGMRNPANKVRKIQFRNVALTQILEAHVLAELGDQNKALRLYKSAVDLIPSSVPDIDFDFHMDVTFYHIQGYALHYLGRHLIRTAADSGDPEQQLQNGNQLLLQAMVIRRRLADEHPQSNWKRDLGITLTELAMLAHRSNQPGLATTYIDEAVKILSDLVEKSERLDFELCLAQSLIQRGKQSGLTNRATRFDFKWAEDLCNNVLQISPAWQECQVALEEAKRQKQLLQTHSSD